MKYTLQILKYSCIISMSKHIAMDKKFKIIVIKET